LQGLSRMHGNSGPLGGYYITTHSTKHGRVVNTTSHKSLTKQNTVLQCFKQHKLTDFWLDPAPSANFTPARFA